MIIVLSPAKTLDMTPAPEGLVTTRPELMRETKTLMETVRRLKAPDLRRLMDVSEAIADLNVVRFKAFDAPIAEAPLPAVLAFAGDVYVGLGARDLSVEALAWAQDRVRILSGLYGVLRPLDAIRPYRLEMGVRLATARGATLYDFWGDRLAKALNAASQGHEDPTVVNLASQEYFGGVDARALKRPVLQCVFKEEKEGEVRIVSFYAKKARGMMARFVIENRVERPSELREFQAEGYRYNRSLSSDGVLAFTRPQPKPKTDAGSLLEGAKA